MLQHIYIDTKKVFLMIIITAFAALITLFGMAYFGQNTEHQLTIIVITPIIIVLFFIVIIIRLIAIALGEWIAQHPPVLSLTDEGIKISSKYYLWSDITSIEVNNCSKLSIKLKNNEIIRFSTNLWTMSAKVIAIEIKKRMLS